MNQNIKREWVAALRSGDYEQGTGKLKMESDNSKGVCFCCLGVLTDLYAKEKNLTFGYSDNKLKAKDEEEYLCGDVMKWAGLSSKDPEVRVDATDESDNCSLSYYNDNGHDFAEIATLIENNL